ncbi:MAG: 1-deoxy-D-xylulose-5-phosphate reductoisomerase [bacterium]|nr:1-deoxy-D-xylulose-5-phosphate reductoisomerase [bacterium]
MTHVIVLGSTGSIGTQALEVIAAQGMTVAGLAAGGGDIALLARQVRDTRSPVVAVARTGGAAELREALSVVGHHEPVEVLEGDDAARELAASSRPGWRVLNGVTGALGLPPTLATLEAGATLALANKESLVAGGDLVRAAQQFPGQVVPVDSEHSAIAQALTSGVHRRGMCAVPAEGESELDGESELARIILTASGGPFRGRSRGGLDGVTAEQALAHPTWSMGPVVTLNSSTLVNKGLELIEAHLLFDVPPEDIEVTVHPQSIVHSGVEWQDGSTILQASPPDMRLPIALGLTWPERRYPVPACDWTQATTWTFEPVDDETFPAIRLARQAVAASATHPAVLNAANEECVDAFLAGRVAWLDIVNTVRAVVEDHEGTPRGSATLESVRAAEDWARREARRRLEAR